jgi:hypothetical protein
MVADLVAGFDDLPYQFGVGPGLRTDQKEAGLNLVLL